MTARAGNGQCRNRVQAVWKLFFGDRDEISIQKVGLRCNNDSSRLPSRFKCCEIGLDVRVFTHGV